MLTNSKLTRIGIAVLLGLSISFNASGSGDKKKKKKGQPAQPEKSATVIETVRPAPPQPKPANGSLFTDGSLALTLVGDFKPRRVGDLVFVDVTETSTANVSSNASRSRDSGTLGGLAGLLAALPSPSAAAISSVVNGLGQRSYAGKGSTGRTSDLKARIAARVIEVLPNGDLRIEADKMVKINKEDERLTVSGIVRQRDISPDNAVASTAVGELRVALSGRGVASADNQPGWLFRIFDKISPF
jgi:flagellar L-ring protein precursor FlgH